MTKIIKDSTIFKTEDYSFFKRINGNRRLSKSHIKRLANAFNEDPNAQRYNPIIVNTNGQVIDGQHRLEALRELKLPVYFVQEDNLGLKEVQKLNANTKNWSPTDYAVSFAEIGNENYKIYLDFKKRFKLNHDVLQQYLSLNNPITTEAFKTQKLKVENASLTEQICQELNDLREYYPRTSYRAIALGFLKIRRDSDNDSYDHTRMVEKFKKAVESTKWVRELDACNNALDGARVLENIYNHGLPTEKKVRFF